jgi:hypothetical protein
MPTVDAGQTSSGGARTSDTTRGDYGFTVRGNDNIVENSISEGNAVGFQLMRGSAGNRFLGDISLNDGSGAVVNEYSAALTSPNTQFSDFLAEGSSTVGFQQYWSKGTHCSHCSLLHGAKGLYVDLYDLYFDWKSLLLNPTTGAIACGASVSGINDVADASCGNVHERLHIGTGGCPSPIEYRDLVASDAGVADAGVFDGDAEPDGGSFFPDGGRVPSGGFLLPDGGLAWRDGGTGTRFEPWTLRAGCDCSGVGAGLTLEVGGGGALILFLRTRKRRRVSRVRFGARRAM